MIFIGIDPGKTGSVVALRQDVDKFHSDIAGMMKLSETPHDIADWLRGITDGQEAFAFIERVGPMRGRDGRKQGVSSAFTFGMNYGTVRGILVGVGVPFDDVLPVKWQSALGCLSGGDKKVTRAKAQQLFTQVKVTHWMADGLLLAEYCRRTRAR